MKTLGCIGCGTMGGAILQGLANNAPELALYGFTRTPQRLAPLVALGIQECQSAQQLVENAQYILIGVKPYQVFDVLQTIRPFLRPEQIIISLAAGVSLARMQEALEGTCAVVRCMPNTPAKVGKGVFALCFDDPKLSEKGKADILAFFNSLGVALELAEAQFTAFSALVGAGPAYVFAMMQGLVQAGVTLGFSWAQSRAMITALFEGAACMAEQSTTPLLQLRDDVCSPGGLTIAGVNVLDRAGLQGLLVDAVLAAQQRGKEMEKEG